MNIILSVIIPTYNTDYKALARCIRSILAQSMKEIEIIIVDDGNTELYRKMTYSKSLFHDDKIKIIYQDNKGVSAARNTGLAMARGTYITFVDSDDIVLGNFFLESICTAKKYNADIVIGGMIRINSEYNENQMLNDKDKITVFYPEKYNEVRALFLGGSFKFGRRGGYIGRGPVAKIVKSDIAKDVKFDRSLSIYEDTVWNLDVVDHSKKICLRECIWYGYFIVEQSATNSFHYDELYRSTVGMRELSKRINFSAKNLQVKFTEQCLLEYCRIVNSFFLSDKNANSYFQKIGDSKKFIHGEPWNQVYNKGVTEGMDMKMKLRLFLVRYNLWLPFKIVHKGIKSLKNGL